MATAKARITLQDFQVLWALFALLFTIGAPWTSNRRIKLARLITWVCGIQLVSAWGSVVLLLLEAWFQSQPVGISVWYRVFFAIAALWQSDRLFDDGSRAWNPYLWSWIIGSVHETMQIVIRFLAKQPFDTWSTLELVFDFWNCSVFILLAYIVICHSDGYEPVPQEPDEPTPATEGTKTETDFTPEYIKRTPQEEIRELGGLWPWIMKFGIFWPVIWPVGHFWTQVCFVLTVILIAARKMMQIYSTYLLALFIDKFRDATTWNDIYPSFLWWAISDSIQTNFGLKFLTDWLWMHVQTYRQRKLKIMLYAKVMDLSSVYHNLNDPNDTLNTIDRGDNIDEILDSLIITTAPSIITACVAIYAIVRMCGPFMILVLMVGVSLFSISIRRSTIYISTSYSKLFVAGDEHRRQRQDTISGWRTVENYNMIQSEVRVTRAKVNVLTAENCNFRYKWFRQNSLNDIVVILTSNIGVLSIAVGGMYGKNTGGNIAAYRGYWALIMQPLLSFRSDSHTLMQRLQDATRARRLLELVPERKGEKTLDFQRGKVEFKNINFFRGKRCIFRNLNLCIAPGTSVGIVGRTGEGKTTLLKLFTKQVLPSGGEVLIDDQNITHVSSFSLREKIGVLEQDSQMFNKTIKENLMYAKPDASEKDIHTACEKAFIHDTIMALPDKYESFIGRDGNKLSGGEKQRLMLARLFLRDPSVVFIDEGTSALDVETEALVQQSIVNTFKKRTLIVIAHRLTTIMNFDNIVVIGKEGVAETGTHRSLLNQKGLYWELWQAYIGNNQLV